jgi:hypothetical protein
MIYYFAESKTKEQATEFFKHLAKIHHPAKGGKPETWAAINAQFLAYKEPEPQPEPQAAQEEPATQKEVPECVIHAAKLAKEVDSALTVEIVGKWVWVTGDTKQHWPSLKAIGFYYSAKKESCYYHDPKEKFKKRTKRLVPHEEVIKKYGVQQLF